jgi:protein phosphatase 1 regulatory subunit 7
MLSTPASNMSEAEASGAAAEPVDETVKAPAPSPSPKPGTPTSRSGWDGKLRVNKQATLVNPEAISDPEYSDDDAPPVQQIEADEDLLEGEDPDVEVRQRNRAMRLRTGPG